MTNARIERLSREALGPQKRAAYSELDDALLRAVGIVVLIVTVVAFASWPREDGATPRQVTKSSAVPSSSPVPSVSHTSARNAGTVLIADHTPIY
jgi:hypothetical protein